jgi:hypothetical protein
MKILAQPLLGFGCWPRRQSLLVLCDLRFIQSWVRVLAHSVSMYPCVTPGGVCQALIFPQLPLEAALWRPSWTSGWTESDSEPLGTLLTVHIKGVT